MVSIESVYKDDGSYTYPRIPQIFKKNNDFRFKKTDDKILKTNTEYEVFEFQK